MSGQSRPFKIPRAMGKSKQDGDGGGEIRHERQYEPRGSWRPCPLLMDRRRRHSLSSTYAAAPFPSTMAIRADPWRLSGDRCQWPRAGPCLRATNGGYRLVGPTADRLGGRENRPADREIGRAIAPVRIPPPTSLFVKSPKCRCAGGRPSGCTQLLGAIGLV